MVSHDGSVELMRVLVCYVLAVKVERVMLRLRGVGKLSFGQAVGLWSLKVRCDVSRYFVARYSICNSLTTDSV
jgi:hypothetical protein